nr:DUF5683 domain-containing protein [uncultured Porphyromonas sp.]
MTASSYRPSLFLGLVLLLGAASARASAPDSLLTLRSYPSFASTGLQSSPSYVGDEAPHPLRIARLDSLVRTAEEPQVQLSPQATAIAPLWQPNSTKALLWALLPGGGQIYNRKYWKLPIVWGALTACYYAISWNNRQYRDYHEAYRDIMSADPATNTAWLAFAPAGAKAEDYAQYSSLRSTLKRGNDYYRRYRDLSIVATVLVYGLSLLDAYVDAELYTFDISPDLSLRLSPEIAVPALPRPALQLGVNCSLTF